MKEKEKEKEVFSIKGKQVIHQQQGQSTHNAF